MAWVDYDTHARSRPRDDLWGQVRRTVGGQPVGPEQIAMIVSIVLGKLGLGAADTLLDLACGNGALTAELHPHCKASLGVDLSPYLVDVAQERFGSGEHGFTVSDIAAYARAEPAPARFTKALCYGSLSYLSDQAVADLLHTLAARFVNVGAVLLGNLPDPARAAAFYAGRTAPCLDEPQSDIGVWRSQDRLARLAGPAWTLSASTMAEPFFAAHYRFDVLLTRRA